MNKFLLWGTCILCGVIWGVISLGADDDKKEGCYTRGTIWFAASIIILGLD